MTQKNLDKFFDSYPSPYPFDVSKRIKEGYRECFDLFEEFKLIFPEKNSEYSNISNVLILGCGHVEGLYHALRNPKINFDCIDILHMLQHDKDIVVGAYPKKDLDWREIERKVLQGKQRSIEELKSLGSKYALNFDWIVNEQNDAREINIKNGLIKLKDAATGFMLIKREVFLKMMDAYPELYFQNDLDLPAEESKYTYLFFDAMHEQTTKRYLSEDYAFCRRWQKIGGEVWLDPLIKLDHIGHFTFPGEISKLFLPTDDPNLAKD